MTPEQLAARGVRVLTMAEILKQQLQRSFWRKSRMAIAAMELTEDDRG